LEICALTDTLILDEDGVYDPAHFNDRLLLGLKGTMSEAELHVMQARMRGGLLSKAHRGELHVPLPVGFLYNTDGHVTLDPDHQVQESIRFLFHSFHRLGSAAAVVKGFRDASLLFPHRPRGGTTGRRLDLGEIADQPHALRAA
jgi:DNA invertase Pin-like site-specific DNA recombinase